MWLRLRLQLTFFDFDPRSAPVAAFLAEVCKRAIRASKGKFEGLHAQHKKSATAPRHG